MTPASLLDPPWAPRAAPTGTLPEPASPRWPTPPTTVPSRGRSGRSASPRGRRVRVAPAVASDIHLHERRAGRSPRAPAASWLDVRGRRGPTPCSCSATSSAPGSVPRPSQEPGPGALPRRCPGARSRRRGTYGSCSLQGNHDFLMGPELEAACGVEVYSRRGSTSPSAGRPPSACSTGTRFCTRDVGYHRLHRILRSGVPCGGSTAALAGQVDPGEAIAAEALVNADGPRGPRPQQGPHAVMDDRRRRGARRSSRTGHGRRRSAATCTRRATTGLSRRLVPARAAWSSWPTSSVRVRTCATTGAGFDAQSVLRRSDARFGLPAASDPVVATLDGPAGSGKSSVSPTSSPRGSAA